MLQRFLLRQQAVSQHGRHLRVIVRELLDALAGNSINAAIADVRDAAGGLFHHEGRACRSHQLIAGETSGVVVNFFVGNLQSPLQALSKGLRGIREINLLHCFDSHRARFAAGRVPAHSIRDDEEQTLRLGKIQARRGKFSAAILIFRPQAPDVGTLPEGDGSRPVFFAPEKQGSVSRVIFDGGDNVAEGIIKIKAK